jgi:WD40 repeat protein
MSSHLFCTLPQTKFICVVGFWDNSIKLFSSENAKQIKSFFGHADVVRCVSISPEGSVLATGARDSVIMTWDVKYSAQVELVPRATLVGHEHGISCIAVDAQQDIVVSCSSGLCLIHTIDGDLLHALSHATLVRPHLITISCNAQFVVFYRDKSSPSLVLYHTNGRLLASVAVSEQLMQMKVTSNGEFLVTGGFGQTLAVRRLYDLAPLLIYEACGASIRSLTFVMHEAYVVAALSSGMIASFEVDLVTWQSLEPIAEIPTAIAHRDDAFAREESVLEF